MDAITRYFPNLTDRQRQQFEQLPDFYREWNARINLISRQDLDNLEIKHVLHSLAIAKAFSFVTGARLLDLGTGGGFPGIPLAILLPEVHFTLIDGTGKKIAAVQELIKTLTLTNAIALHTRAEEMKQRQAFDFVVSRAVAPLPQLLQWSQPLLRKKHQHAYPNGLIALKGGNLKPEIDALPGKAREYVEVFAVQDFFPESAFEEKWVVYVQG
ncbi:MAG: 16S rRNA (guanine(527)-N(7))-methyltransferase RsmG [Saprospiraceae bacterium]|nr:16S rRNA (guanine(527)-N(7))-methyltransferase RsmG [Saprospiraceae bacterium]MDW8228368.1 16S rRNA (guanine(527)-N(7))-methyltransferase RsmG [Saprospiraceae bacterium]